MVNNTNFFERMARIFRAKERITSESLTYFFIERRDRFSPGCSFVKTRRERFAHGGSFLKSDESESLMVTL